MRNIKIRGFLPSERSRYDYLQVTLAQLAKKDRQLLTKMYFREQGLKLFDYVNQREQTITRN